MKLFISFTRQIQRNKFPFLLTLSFRERHVRRNSSDFNRGSKNQPWGGEKKKKSVYQDAQGFWLGQGGRDWPSEWKRGIGIVGLRWPAGWQWNRATVNELIAGTIIIPRSRAPLRPRRLLADYESIVASVINPSHLPTPPCSCPRIDGQRRNLSSRATLLLYPGRICDSFGISPLPLDCDGFFFFSNPAFFFFLLLIRLMRLTGRFMLQRFSYYYLFFVITRPKKFRILNFNILNMSFLGIVG